MIASLALLLLLADEGATTLPRHGDVVPVEERPADRKSPPIRLFDRPHVATDDAAFVLAAIESSRQGVIDARSAAEAAPQRASCATPRRRSAGRTKRRAHDSKRSPTPRAGACRRAIRNATATFPTAGETRTAANFIVSQIAFHEATLAQYRAQLGGKGDAELKRALRDTLPGYQKNLDLLLRLKL